MANLNFLATLATSVAISNFLGAQRIAPKNRTLRGLSPCKKDHSKKTYKFVKMEATFGKKFIDVPEKGPIWPFWQLWQPL